MAQGSTILTFTVYLPKFQPGEENKKYNTVHICEQEVSDEYLNKTINFLPLSAVIAGFWADSSSVNKTVGTKVHVFSAHSIAGANVQS